MSNEEKVVTKKEIGILDLFSPNELKEKSDGNFQTECPSCGLQGGRTQGFILFPEKNTWFCHSSGKHGGILELVALQNKLISCLDCRETGEKRKVLEGELFKQTLDVLKEKYDEEVYDGILECAGVRKSIQLPGNGVLISEFADKLVNRFKSTYEMFFREDLDEVVEVSNSSFKIIRPARFITLTERYFRPWTIIYTRYGQEIKNKSMTGTDANVVLVSPNFQDSIPRIKRIFTFPIPIIYQGKLTFPRKGYDERFESWLNFNSPTIKEMSLDEAKNILYKIYNEFCFQDKQDYTNAIAGLITPALRGLYPSFNTRTPCFNYVANRERAGKDYCRNVTALVYEGSCTEESPLSSGEYKTSGTSDETRKKIFSNLILGKKLYHSANNKGKINNAVFEYVLTAKTISDRMLGKNEIKTIDNEMDYSLSGNLGMTMTPDLINRSVFVRLFLDIEDANERRFSNPNLHFWVLENRDSILSAIYSLIKNWIDKGMPVGSVPFASYPEWSAICGGIMESAELGNPCFRDKTTIQGIALDEDTDEMKALFEYIHELKPDEFLTKQDIRKLLEADVDKSVMAWINWEDKSHQIKFGQKIEKFVGRILSDIRLVVEDLSVRPARRKYKLTKEKSNFDKNLIFGVDFKENQKEIDNNRNFDGKVGNDGNDGNLLPNPRFPYIYNIYKGNSGTAKTLPALPTLPEDSKLKSDRKVQFYDADECESIIPKCSKEDVLKFLQENPGKDYQQLYENFGVGCLKFRNQLKREGKI